MRRAAAAAGLLAAVLAVSACTGDDEPSDGESPGGSTGTGGAQGAEQLTDEYLSATPAPAQARAEGFLDPKTRQKPGTIEVVDVRASQLSTAVRWRLKPAGGGTVSLDGIQFQRDIQDRSVSFTGADLLAPSANLKLQPGTYSAEGGGSSSLVRCTCSKVPSELGPDGADLSLLFPPVPEEVTSVQLQVPGFPAVTVPVTRG